MPDKGNQDKRLRFNAVQVAEWLAELREREPESTTVALSKAVGLSQTRVTQYLNLLRIPGKYRGRLKTLDALTEHELHPTVAMTPKHQARVIRRLLSRIQPLG